MDQLRWVSENWGAIITLGLAVIGGASVAIKAIAPLTKSDLDNKLDMFLDKVLAFLGKIALQPPKSK